MLATLGHKVQRLKRVTLGPLKLGNLPQGDARPLERTELAAVKRLISGEGTIAKAGRSKTVTKARGLQSESPNARSGRKEKKSKPRSVRKKTRAQGKR